jgi:hypothetical protein
MSLALKTPSILIECTSSQKLCTDLSKHLEHRMLDFKLLARSWVCDGECRQDFFYS